MNVVRLAWLNLVRNPRRGLLTLGAIIVGVAVVIVGQGIIGGFRENHIRAQVDTASGHFVLRPADYPTQGLAHPLDRAFRLDTRWTDWLDANAQAWTTRTLIQANAVAGADSMQVRIVSIDPERDAAVFPRDHWSIEGIEPRHPEQGALVSTGVARLLRLSVGDGLTLQARTADGAINALQVPVAGISTVGTPLMDVFTVVVPDALGDQLVLTGPRVTHVPVRLARRSDTLPFATSLQERVGPDLDVVTWKDETEGVLAVQDVRRAALGLLVFALMGMSATGIANTMLIAAYERTREIGTLQAMGMTRSVVVALFVLEGGFLGVLGAVGGALLGGSLVRWYSTHGIELPLAFGDSGHIPVSNLLYLEYTHSAVVLALLFGITVAVLASLYPAVVASRMRPAEAVRH